MIGAPSPQQGNKILDHDIWALNPRLGFAWDVFGNGNTALRGGMGLFSDKPPYLAFINYLTANLPFDYTPSLSVYQGDSLRPSPCAIRRKASMKTVHY